MLRCRCTQHAPTGPAAPTHRVAGEPASGPTWHTLAHARCGTRPGQNVWSGEVCGMCGRKGSTAGSVHFSEPRGAGSREGETHTIGSRTGWRHNCSDHIAHHREHGGALLCASAAPPPGHGGVWPAIQHAPVRHTLPRPTARRRGAASLSRSEARPTLLIVPWRRLPPLPALGLATGARLRPLVAPREAQRRGGTASAA